MNGFRMSEQDESKTVAPEAAQPEATVPAAVSACRKRKSRG